MNKTLIDWGMENGYVHKAPKEELKVTSQAGAMKQFVSKDRVSRGILENDFPRSAQEIAIKQACEELANTLIMKNRDYGKGNIVEFGELGILVRLSDKYTRLKNLIDNDGTVAFEPIEDSWKDMAGYAVIGWLNSQGRW